MAPVGDVFEDYDAMADALATAPEPPEYGTHREVQEFLTAYRAWWDATHEARGLARILREEK